MSSPLQEPLQKHPQQQDCLPCRLSGGAVGLGVGYISLRKALQFQRKATIKSSPTRAAVGLGVTGVMFASAGIYRLFFY